MDALTLTPINTHHKEYPFVERLLHQSFPEEERRDDSEQRYHTDQHPQFTCFLAAESQSGTPVGLLTVWALDGFHYIEHLATSPQSRNKGYGQLIMQLVKNRFPGLIVLEVERPDNEWSTRRIGFYRRCGFKLCTQNYLQPPYRPGGKSLPLYLMYCGAESIDPDFPRISHILHKHVYGVAD